MTATLIGESTIAACIPGVYASLVATGDALIALKGVVEDNIDALNAIASADLRAQIDANVAAIDAGAGQALLDQINAAADLQVELGLVSDAAAWLNNIIAQINASIDLLVDADAHLAASIAGVDLGLAASVEAKAALDLSLEMPDVQASLDATAAISVALDVAVQAALPGVSAYVELVSKLLSAGVAIVHFNGQLQDFGTDCDGALAGSSLSPTGNTTGVALVVSNANPTTEANFKLAFGIS